MYEIAFELA